MPQLTFTRFIAALLIVFYHFGLVILPDNQSILYNFIKLAPAGVSYFFLLSGFILTFVYDKGPGSVINKKQFYLSRFARIYQVYILALVILLIFLFLTKQTIDLKALFLQATLLQSWSPKFSATLNIPSWSLSVEVFFYALFPFLLVGLRSIKKNWLLVLSGLSFWLISLGFYYYGLNNYPVNTSIQFHHFFNYNPLLHLNSFVIGVIACLLYKRFMKPLSARQSLLLMVAPFLAIFVLSITNNPILHYYNNGLLAPLFAVFIIGLACDETIISKILSARPLVLLGEISYGIYILQVPVNYWWYAFYDRFFNGYPALRFISFLVFLFILSWLSYRFIEKPIRRYVKEKNAVAG